MSTRANAVLSLGARGGYSAYHQDSRISVLETISSCYSSFFPDTGISCHLNVLSSFVSMFNVNSLVHTSREWTRPQLRHISTAFSLSSLSSCLAIVLDLLLTHHFQCTLSCQRRLLQSSLKSRCIICCRLNCVINFGSLVYRMSSCSIVIHSIPNNIPNFCVMETLGIFQPPTVYSGPLDNTPRRLQFHRREACEDAICFFALFMQCI